MFKKNGKDVRPYVVTNSDVLDAFTEDDVCAYLTAELKKKTRTGSARRRSELLHLARRIPQSTAFPTCS